MDLEAVIQTKNFRSIGHRTIIHLLLVNNTIIERIGQALKPFGVSMQQFNVLRILRGQKGSAANLNTLNDRMISKMSNTTRLVDKLIDKEFVSRAICESNRRKIEIFITPAGEEALAEMDSAVQMVETEMMKEFTDNQLEMLNSLLNRIS
jgi:DNA-binding MarR family transcriptional regulator